MMCRMLLKFLNTRILSEMFVFEYLIMDLCSLVGLKCENVNFDIGSESSDNLIEDRNNKAFTSYKYSHVLLLQFQARNFMIESLV